MSELNLQFDFENSSEAELRRWLQDMLPTVEKFVHAAKRFCSIDAQLSDRLPCDFCEKRASCQSLCEKAEAVLSNVHQGKGRRENLTEFHDDTLQGKETVRRKDIFEKYALWKSDFTARQWAIIELHYQDGLTENQIAKKVGKVRTAINGLLNRAKKRLEDRDRQLRQEAREQIKIMVENGEI